MATKVSSQESHNCRYKFIHWSAFFAFCPFALDSLKPRPLRQHEWVVLYWPRGWTAFLPVLLIWQVRNVSTKLLVMIRLKWSLAPSAAGMPWCPHTVRHPDPGHELRGPISTFAGMHQETVRKSFSLSESHFTFWKWRWLTTVTLGLITKQGKVETTSPLTICDVSTLFSWIGFFGLGSMGKRSSLEGHPQLQNPSHLFIAGKRVGTEFTVVLRYISAHYGGKWQILQVPSFSHDSGNVVKPAGTHTKVRGHLLH